MKLFFGVFSTALFVIFIIVLSLSVYDDFVRKDESPIIQQLVDRQVELEQTVILQTQAFALQTNQISNAEERYKELFETCIELRVENCALSQMMQQMIAYIKRLENQDSHMKETNF